MDYVPASIPLEREVNQNKSYFKHKLACATLLVVTVIATVGGVCGSGHCGNGSESAPVTSAPTSYRSTLSLEFEAQLLEEFGEDYLHEESDSVDARWKALNWILYEDPLQLEPSAENFIQRFIMTLFYFQTSIEGPWEACDPSGPELCYSKIISKIESLGNAWLSDYHECFWATVECSGIGNRNVTAINWCKFAGLAWSIQWFCRFSFDARIHSLTH